MLARIGGIKGIGRLDCGHCAFSKVTLIYGRNGAGKSTLADILRAAGNLDDGPIRLRCEIRADGTCADKQTVKLSFTPESGGQEAALGYDSGAWNGTTAPFKIRVFDTAFIEANVFTGTKHEHSNRQALTNLILGEEAVSAEKDLQAAQSELKVIRASSDDLQSSLERRIARAHLDISIADLLATPNTPEANIKDAIEAHESEIAALNKIQQDASGVRALQPLDQPSMHADLTALAENLREADTVERPVPDTVALEYVRSTVLGGATEDEALDWLRSGWRRVSEQTEDQTCPFCAQSLAPADDLMRAYATLFDGSSRHYADAVSAKVAEVKSGAAHSQDACGSMVAMLGRNTARVEALRPYVSQEDAAAIDALHEASGRLAEATTSLQACAKQIQNCASNALAVVNTSPSKEWQVAIPNADEAHETDSSLVAAQTAYTEKASAVNDVVRRLHETASADSGKEIMRLTELLATLRADSRRYEWADDLAKYTTHQDRITQLKRSVPELKAAVLAEQEKFVAGYFKRVNELLGNLTVSDFTVVHEKNTSGTDPVYGIGLKYRGQQISSQRVPFTLSDGDRRTLALAIFIARLEHDEDMSKVIAVFDDPVTSLDTHRTRATVTEILRLSEKLRQVIILSHFKSLLDRLLSRLPQSETACLECSRNGGSSSISVMDPAEIVLTEYDRLIEAAFSYGDGNDVGVSPRTMLQDTRIIIEKEIRSRCRLHLEDCEGVTLGSMLDHLAEKGVLSGELLTELRDLNNETSDEHHEVGQDYDPDDVRTVTRRATGLLFDAMIVPSPSTDG